MRTTADPRKLFREVDATGLSDAGSYTFYVDKGKKRANVVAEGKEFPREEDNVEEHLVKFEDFVDNSNEKKLALDALKRQARAHLADTPIDTTYEYDTLFIDRDTDETYLVDTSRFGYKVVSETDEKGDSIAGAYEGIFEDAALRVR